jgi:hypothetical protein
VAQSVGVVVPVGEMKDVGEGMGEGAEGRWRREMMFPSLSLHPLFFMFHGSSGLKFDPLSV